MIVIRRVTLAIAALLMLLSSCKARQSDPRAELEGAIKGANVAGFVYSFTEDDNTATAAFTNPAFRTGLQVDKQNPHADIRYTRIRDKKSGATKTYRAEAVPSGRTPAIRVTDLDTNRVIANDPFVPAASCNVDNKTYPSIQACEADFFCSCLPALQCQANATCQDIRDGFDCRIAGQPTGVSVDILVRPNSLRCQVVGYLPENGGLLKQ